MPSCLHHCAENNGRNSGSVETILGTGRIKVKTRSKRQPVGRAEATLFRDFLATEVIELVALAFQVLEFVRHAVPFGRIVRRRFGGGNYRPLLREFFVQFEKMFLARRHVVF